LSRVRGALIAVALLWAAMPRAAAEPHHLLYFTLSAGYRHEVIPLSAEILRGVGARSGAFELTESEDVAVFAPDSLRRYAAVMFFTTGELPLSAAQKSAFLTYVRSGHGFLGVHSATDTFYSWPGYLGLIGGYFNGHPWHQAVTVKAAAYPITAFLGGSFTIDDEIYQISDFDYRRATVLLRLDPSSVDLSKPGVQRRFYGWPLAWRRSYGKGRVFYSALGHDPAVWRDERYQQMLLNAIGWAMGR
jgi:type 1 glutamine amidotransferase